ncbi:Phospho-N-acetylmuramoyl-pentapeptide-transferase [Rickettsiales endosymbiont of Paramecium tredecaurelia]|uniref:phospho-N-acetylmuramoyl-pentapeptide- transferase n=1 Tax=Candidatus Sarmatiella mevalonica TaxID=2770581 RepID=UPI001920BF53|nr:phospho-N-acetylmuramoyl-pentapeptide-transferase [Candidatus Sarmatiella mevalonica]MBL3285170.1 Phospho-N-acetylmuramoyl-pentapeptide-transferase [Candidatus Sarmatiella mevalonica]
MLSQNSTVYLLYGLASVIISFISYIILCKPFILYLTKLNGLQPIRSDGPKSHVESKRGTPTLGGALLMGVCTPCALLFAYIYNNHLVYSYIFLFLGFGCIGFVDDYFKLTKKSSKGISAGQKLILQFSVALVFLFTIQNTHLFEYLYIPYLKLRLYFNNWQEWIYIIFLSIVIVGTTNAVNLTDGLDGLLVGPIIFNHISLILLLLFLDELQNSCYHQSMLQLLPTICSMIGALLGFLWFNAYPAQIFIGDTGSMALGAFLAGFAVITKQELLLPIIGLVFVCEALSVILQVGCFKFTKGRRIFRMAPLHHHFEQLGMNEVKITIRFWIIAFLCSLVGLLSII